MTGIYDSDSTVFPGFVQSQTVQFGIHHRLYKKQKKPFVVKTWYESCVQITESWHKSTNCHFSLPCTVNHEQYPFENVCYLVFVRATYLTVFTAKQMGSRRVRLFGLRIQAIVIIARGPTVWKPTLKRWGGPTTATSDTLKMKNFMLTLLTVRQPAFRWPSWAFCLMTDESRPINVSTKGGCVLHLTFGALHGAKKM